MGNAEEEATARATFTWSRSEQIGSNCSCVNVKYVPMSISVALIMMNGASRGICAYVLPS